MTTTAMCMASAVAALVLRCAAVRSQPGIFAGCNKALAAAKVGNIGEAVEVSFATLYDDGPMSDPFDGVEW